ncbi:SGNH/GDSL hydrolase family protein [Salinibacter sp.]|uniref:SGNH/GDSL hydrolase family protein n=1 Tax=Salinibacter sp. TaxID=2065818 RepID=UPI0021E8DF27|nr:SGNH/GDSL hydrolase family protein [Salinibacter sp.]
MGHLVLLGDSVFDNGAYVGPDRPDVAQQVRARLSGETELPGETEPPGKTEVTLLARDGHYVSDVPRQMRQLPNSATHLFLSAGGNDGLRYLDAIEGFDREVQPFSGAVRRLREIQEDFREDYRPVLQEVLRAELPTALCTVYNGHFQERETQDLIDTILPVINDVIIEAAVREGLPLIDLGRALCEPDRDYANSIEPSAQGGQKIAGAVAEIFKQHEFSSPRAEIYV